MIPNSVLNSRASSPMVSPCRRAIGNCPTKEVKDSIEQVSLDVHAVHRVRPVADNDLQAVPCRGPHAVGHRVGVGIDARAHVLQIDHQRVEAKQHVLGGLADFAVQREHRHGAARVPAVWRFDHVVLQVGAESVLRAEDRCQPDLRILEDRVGAMAETAAHRRRVADETNPLPGEKGTVRSEESIDPERHGCGGWCGCWHQRRL